MLQSSGEAREVLWSAWEEARQRLWTGMSRSSLQRELEAWVRRLVMLTDHGDPGYAAAVRYCAGLGLNGGTRDWRRAVLAEVRRYISDRARRGAFAGEIHCW